MKEFSKLEKEIMAILKVSSGSSNQELIVEIKQRYKEYKKKLPKLSSSAVPTIIVGNKTSTVEHEASVGRVSEQQLFYLQTRGLDQNSAVSLIITKNFSEILSSLPLEFAIEAKKLIETNLAV